MHIYRLKATGNVIVIGRANTGKNFMYFLKSFEAWTVGSRLSVSTGFDYCWMQWIFAIVKDAANKGKANIGSGSIRFGNHKKP